MIYEPVYYFKDFSMQALIADSLDYYIKKNTVRDSDLLISFITHVIKTIESFDKGLNSDWFDFSFQLNDDIYWSLRFKKTDDIIEGFEENTVLRYSGGKYLEGSKSYGNVWISGGFNDKLDVSLELIMQYIDRGAKLYIYYPERYVITREETLQIENYRDYFRRKHFYMKNTARDITLAFMRRAAAISPTEDRFDTRSAETALQDFAFSFQHFDFIDYSFPCPPPDMDRPPDYLDAYVNLTCLCNLLDIAGEMLNTLKAVLLDFLHHDRFDCIGHYRRIFEPLEQEITEIDSDIEGYIEELYYYYRTSAPSSDLTEEAAELPADRECMEIEYEEDSFADEDGELPF